MDPGEEPSPAAAPVALTLDLGAPEPEQRFLVDVPGFRGPLDELVRRVQRGDVDAAQIQVATITEQFRGLVESDDRRPDLEDIAAFLTLVARLIAFKAAAVMPDTAASSEDGDEDDGQNGAGSRLTEYRLYKAAAEALLAGTAEDGARSFLGVVSPDVIPVERMRIPPERLAAAFRRVLERLAGDEPLPVGAATFSVVEKVEELRTRLAAGLLQFEELFSAVRTRLEAVACFLALLELLRLGEATVEQREPFGPITVRGDG